MGSGKYVLGPEFRECAGTRQLPEDPIPDTGENQAATRRRQSRGVTQHHLDEGAAQVVLAAQPQHHDRPAGLWYGLRQLGLHHLGGGEEPAPVRRKYDALATGEDRRRRALPGVRRRLVESPPGYRHLVGLVDHEEHHGDRNLSLIHISEPTRLLSTSYA